MPLNRLEPIKNAATKAPSIIKIPISMVFFLPILDANIPTGINIAIAATCATISGKVNEPPLMPQTFSANTEKEEETAL